MESETIYTVYILQSLQNDSYYIGYTSNMERRLQEHNEGRSRYTAGKTPWKLVHTETYADKTIALKREIEIKKKKKRTYIEFLIRNQG